MYLDSVILIRVDSLSNELMTLMVRGIVLAEISSVFTVR